MYARARVIVYALAQVKLTSVLSERVYTRTEVAKENYQKMKKVKLPSVQWQKRSSLFNGLSAVVLVSVITCYINGINGQGEF